MMFLATLRARRRPPDSRSQILARSAAARAYRACPDTRRPAKACGAVPQRRLPALRQAAAALLLGLLAALPWHGALAAIQVTDVLGREVTLPAPAQRVVLAQARHFQVLSLLSPDPARILAGWSDEFKTSFKPNYEAALRTFPALAKVPVVGRHTADSFSVESTLAQRPDLVVLTAAFAGLAPGQDPGESPLIGRFEAAGVPVIVVDFFVRPLQNTVPSLRALGRALGEEARAEAFIAFYEHHMQTVAERLAGLDEAQRPPVFVHAHAGSTGCCNSPGKGTFNEMVRFAGGHNIGADVLKSPTGRLNFEYIHSRAPRVYVATGTGARPDDGLAIGAGVSEDQARASLRHLIEANRLEALAHWIHPDRFADVDPAETLQEINARFLATPLEGTYLVDLEPGR